MSDEEDFFNSPTENSAVLQPVDGPENSVAQSVTQSVSQTARLNQETSPQARSPQTASSPTQPPASTPESGPSTSIANLVNSDLTKRIDFSKFPNFKFSDFATLSIKETEKRVETGNSINNSVYATYLIEVVPKKLENSGSDPAGGDAEASKNPIVYSSLWRRFSEFDNLRDFLTVTYPHVIVPVVSCKTIARFQKTMKSNIMYGNKAAHREKLESPLAGDDPLLLETRKIELERFLNIISQHDQLVKSEIFWSFLQDANEFTYKLKMTGYNSRLSEFTSFLEQAGKQVNDLTNSSSSELDIGRRIYARCHEIELAYRNFVDFYKKMTLAEFSTVNVYENYSRIFNLLAEIEISLRKELSYTSPMLDLFVKIVKEHQDYEIKIPLSKMSEIERTYRKSLKNCQSVHYHQYQNEVKYAQVKLDESKLEKATLSAGSIPKNVSSLRGFGSMLKAVVETSYEREARGKKLERREQLEQQLVNKTCRDFEEFKSKGFLEIKKFEESRQKLTKEILKELIRNRIEYLKKSRDTWEEIYSNLKEAGEEV